MKPGPIRDNVRTTTDELAARRLEQRLNVDPLPPAWDAAFWLVIAAATLCLIIIAWVGW